MSLSAAAKTFEMEAVKEPRHGDRAGAALPVVGGGPRHAGTVRADPDGWVERHGDYLYRYAMLRLRHAALAEDLVQETLLSALRAHGSFAGRSSERTWLTGILKHKILDHFRRDGARSPVRTVEGAEFEHAELFDPSGRWKGRSVQEHGYADWQTLPDLAAERHEFWDVLGRALDELPPRLAAAFVLREIEGLSCGEVCEVLGVSENNVRVMLHRARMHLRHCLEANWRRPPATSVQTDSQRIRRSEGA